MLSVHASPLWGALQSNPDEARRDEKSQLYSWATTIIDRVYMYMYLCISDEYISYSQVPFSYTFFFNRCFLF